MTGTNSTAAHTPPTTAGRTAAGTAGPTPPAAAPAGTALPRPDAPAPPAGAAADRVPRPRTGGTPRPARAVPRPRRSPADRRPLGRAGSGPGATGRSSGPGGRGSGAAGRGPTRTVSGPGPGRPAAVAAAVSRRSAAGTPVTAAGVPLPTAAARRRAQESRPHHWFAQQLLLALSGQRPVHALLGHALPAAYDRLAELAPQAPLWPAPVPGGRGPVPTVRDCGLCRPRRGVIEAFARIAAGERLRALAFRLELGADSRWRCAALDIGPAQGVPGAL
ncbi:Rv3235 family protein [Streptomyces sp. NBC_01456]|uniref:Rv3235 family protein n=1 Tax=unclassified Streptomyces TaxID=2593676 RepID=UPI002E35DA84|nr:MULTISPECIES: Rv3235 family protein [unclassified Streptomyces]